MTADPQSTSEFPGLPDIEGGIARYRADFFSALRRDPVRTLFRIARRRRDERRQKDPPLTSPNTVSVPKTLRPPSYRYRGFGGPWLEEYFGATWGGTDRGAAYLPVFFDSLFFHAQCHAFLPGEFRQRYLSLWQVLHALGREPRPFFTLLGMYEFPIWDWHLFPRNIIVVAAAGYGDVAMPLLKGDRPLQRTNKDILVSFMGAMGGPSNVHNVRAEMKTAFDDVAYFGEGPDWESIMARSHFSLCPRGQGPTSFRLFEALSATSIPVYLWKNTCWLPYTDELDWSSFAVVAEAGELNTVRTRVLEMQPETIRAMQDRIAAIYSSYFSYEGACARVRKTMAAVADRADAEALTSARDRFRF